MGHRSCRAHAEEVEEGQRDLVVGARLPVARRRRRGEGGPRARRERGGARGRVVACETKHTHKTARQLGHDVGTHHQSRPCSDDVEDTYRDCTRSGGRGLVGLAAAVRAGVRRRRLRGDAVRAGGGGGGGGVERQRRGAGVVVVVEDDDGRVVLRRRGPRRGRGRRGGLAAAERAGLLSLLARHEDVPVVLDGVVGAPWEEAGDERPLVAVGAGPAG
uniref:Uncharacterized protein n=1 Tax=Setaria italica TaxID=4555 RepID=K3XLV6_SETIT